MRSAVTAGTGTTTTHRTGTTTYRDRYTGDRRSRYRYRTTTVDTSLPTCAIVPPIYSRPGSLI